MMELGHEKAFKACLTMLFAAYLEQAIIQPLCTWFGNFSVIIISTTGRRGRIPNLYRMLLIPIPCDFTSFILKPIDVRVFISVPYVKTFK
jgi:hypothetical protein